jgi:hypothetical protein
MEEPSYGAGISRKLCLSYLIVIPILYIPIGPPIHYTAWAIIAMSIPRAQAM